MESLICALCWRAITNVYIAIKGGGFVRPSAVVSTWPVGRRCYIQSFRRGVEIWVNSVSGRPTDRTDTCGAGIPRVVRSKEGKACCHVSWNGEINTNIVLVV